MEQRDLGRSGLKVSVLGFGCGAVGGLMTRGDPGEQERAIARALELGVTYFDTAADYGRGESEKNLGRIWKSLKPRGAAIGTKIRIPDTDHKWIGACIAAGIDASLTRLGMDSVDLFQLHNPITNAGRSPDLSASAVIEHVIPALQAIQRSGKARHVGITGIGDAEAMRSVIEGGHLASAQIPFNLLNPSADAPLPPNFPAHDFKQIMRHAKAAGTGTIGIRVLAAGALSGSHDRHPTGMPSVDPIASGPSYAADVARAQAFLPLVEEGHVASLVEAALRYVISSDALSTVLIGMSTIEQFETAAQAVLKGPLGQPALDRISEIQRQFA